MDKAKMKKLFVPALGALAVVVLVALVGLVVVYTGSYNVAATEEHASITRWALHTTLMESVSRRADGIVPPESLTEETIATGARMYKETCQHCHAGLGAERAQWANGMRPRPPYLVEAAAHWD